MLTQKWNCHAIRSATTISANFILLYAHFCTFINLGNTSTNDLGGGVWDYWYGPSGRASGHPPINLLVPKIASSVTAKAMAYSGIRLNLTRMGEMQKTAEFNCNQSTMKKVPCNPYQTPCLFNVEDDPCELYNVADRYPNIVQRLKHLLNEFNKTAIPPMKRLAHPEAFPRNHGNIWTTWETPDDDKSSGANSKSPPSKFTPSSGSKLPPTLTTTSLSDNKLGDSSKSGQMGGKNQGNGLAVNYWVGLFCVSFIAGAHRNWETI